MEDCPQELSNQDIVSSVAFLILVGLLPKMPALLFRGLVTGLLPKFLCSILSFQDHHDGSHPIVLL